MIRKALDEEIRMIKAILSIQYDKDAPKILENKEIYVSVSPDTGRVRYIILDGKNIGTLRASDNFFVPSIEGAKIIKNVLPWPKYRVVVTEDAAPFIAKGRTIFCKHVILADLYIRPGDEVFIVDKEDNLVALGKALIAGEDMVAKKRGKAVKNRRGVKNYSL